ncbi:MAG: class I SAM-dependent methyltransferase [Bacteroidetes bacterium]|nr:class I SAM-dependent methyltransferase [Bacteroidota bacterium]
MIHFAEPEKYLEKERLYFLVRNAEQRIVSDALLKQLPKTPKSYIHHREWKIRAASFRRLIKQLGNKPLKILDLGCGNGWLAHLLYQSGHSVTGMDLNLLELQQAERVFGSNKNLQWLYADIMDDTTPIEKYDLIILGASCQYFKDLYALTERLKTFVNFGGSIYFLDSFFYDTDELPFAKQRTEDYYKNLGIPDMGKYYFHHGIADLKTLGYKKRYPVFGFIKKPQWWVLPC